MAPPDYVGDIAISMNIGRQIKDSKPEDGYGNDVTGMPPDFLGVGVHKNT